MVKACKDMNVIELNKELNINLYNKLNEFKKLSDKIELLKNDLNNLYIDIENDIDLLDSNQNYLIYDIKFNNIIKRKSKKLNDKELNEFLSEFNKSKEDFMYLPEGTQKPVLDVKRVERV